MRRRYRYGTPGLIGTTKQRSSAAPRDLNPGYHRLGYNAGSVERLVALTDEHADFSREFSSSFPLRGLVHSGEASGQVLFDGVVGRFESAAARS